MLHSSQKESYIIILCLLATAVCMGVIPPVSADSSADLTSRGISLILDSRYTEALDSFEQALALDSSNSEARLQAGIALYDLGRFKEAFLKFEVVLAGDPGNAEAWTWRGDTLEAMGKPGEAADSYRQALALNPYMSRTWEKLGDILAGEGEWNGALDAWNHAYDINPGDPSLEQKILTATANNTGPGDFLPYILAVCGCVAAAAVILVVWKRKKRIRGISGNDTNVKGASQPEKPIASDLKGTPVPEQPNRPAKKKFPSFLSRNLTPAGKEHQEKKNAREKDGSVSGGTAGLTAALFSTKKGSRKEVPCDRESAASENDPAIVMVGGELLSSHASSGEGEEIGSPIQIAAGFDQVLSGTGAISSGFKGIAYYAMGHYDEALAEFEREIAEGRESAGVFILRAAVFHRRGETGEALASCKSALEREAGSFEGQKLYGDLLAGDGKSTEALHAYDRALSINSYSADVWVARAALLLSLGRGHEALQSCERALGIEPRSPGVLLQKSRILGSLGSYQDALVVIDSAISLDGTDPALFTCKARVLRKLGKHEEALRAYDIALTIHPEDGASWAELAGLFNVMHQHHEEATSFERASALEPGNLQYLIGWSRALDANGEYSAASRIWIRALKIDPADSSSWFHLGTALFKAGKINDALVALDQAVKADPGNLAAWNSRGHVLARLNRYRESSDSYQKALDLDPLNEEAKEGQAILHDHDKEKSDQGPVPESQNVVESSGDETARLEGAADSPGNLPDAQDARKDLNVSSAWSLEPVRKLQIRQEGGYHEDKREVP